MLVRHNEWYIAVTCTFINCIKNAFAQALKVSDAETEKKLCYSNHGTMISTNNGCTTKDSSNTHSHGLVGFYVDGATKKPTWPSKKESETNVDGAKNVAANIIALTKDEKAVVAGHLAKSIEGGGGMRLGPFFQSVTVNACYVLRGGHSCCTQVHY